MSAWSVLITLLSTTVAQNFFLYYPLKLHFAVALIESRYQGSCFVGNKPKVRISKRMFQENKGRQIFQKTNMSYPLDTPRTYQELRNVCLSEDLASFVFLKHPFEIRSLDLIPTIFAERKSAVSYHCFERTFRVLWWKPK